MSHKKMLPLKSLNHSKSYFTSTFSQHSKSYFTVLMKFVTSYCALTFRFPHQKCYLDFPIRSVCWRYVWEY